MSCVSVDLSKQANEVEIAPNLASGLIHVVIGETCVAISWEQFGNLAKQCNEFIERAKDAIVDRPLRFGSPVYFDGERFLDCQRRPINLKL